MKNTLVIELLKNEELNIVGEEDTLALILNNKLRDAAGGNYYLLDERDTLLGVLSEQDLIRYLGGYMPFVDRSGTDAFLSKMESVRIADIVHRDIESVPVNASLIDVLPLMDGGSDEIPVTDTQGRLLGEVSSRSVLRHLDSIRSKGDLLSLRKSS